MRERRRMVDEKHGAKDEGKKEKGDEKHGGKDEEWDTWEERWRKEMRYMGERVREKRWRMEDMGKEAKRGREGERRGGGE